MTLATHAIAGAAVASVMPTHPLLGFCAGFASHFALDAIPHYDYPIFSDSIHPGKGAAMRYDRAFARDMIDFSVDAGLGVLFSWFVFGGSGMTLAVFAGITGGLLPDFLQFVYTRFKHEPLVSLQRLHKWIHATRRLEKEHRLVLGVVSQLAVIAAVVIVAKNTAPLL